MASVAGSIASLVRRDRLAEWTSEIGLGRVAAIDELKSPVLRSERVGDVLQNPSPIVGRERIVLVRPVPAADSTRPDGDRRRGEDLGIDEAASLALGVADARSTEDLDTDPVVALDDVRARRPESRHRTGRYRPRRFRATNRCAARVFAETPAGVFVAYVLEHGGPPS